MSIARAVLVGVAALQGWLPLASGGAEDASQAFTVSQPPFAARLVKADREWNLSFETGGKVRVVSSAELAYFGRYREAEAGPKIVLADGGVLQADVLSLDRALVVVGDATGLGRGVWDETPLPRNAVRGVLLQPPAAVADRDALLREIAAYSASDDRLLLVGGEAVTGTAIAAPLAGRFAPAGAAPGSDVFQLARPGGDEPLRVPAARVRALQFGSAVVAQPRKTGPACWLGLNDGTLIRAASVSVKGDSVTIVLAVGCELTASLAGREPAEKRFWNMVNYVEPTGGRTVWLSDMTAEGYKHIPFISVQRRHGLDCCVVGSRLRAQGAVFRKGIGMPSASRLAFGAEGYRRFAAEIALDAAAGLRGSAVFKVFLESPEGAWQSAYESPIVRGGDRPIPISVDLKGAGRLALLIEFAERGDECDYADWLHARLTR